MAKNPSYCVALLSKTLIVKLLYDLSFLKSPVLQTLFRLYDISFREYRQPFETVFLQKLSRLYEILKDFNNLLRSDFGSLLTQTISTFSDVPLTTLYVDRLACFTCDRVPILYGYGRVAYTL